MTRGAGRAAWPRGLLCLLVALFGLLLPARLLAREPSPLDVGRGGFIDLRPTARLLIDPTRARTVDDLRRPDLRELPAATSESVHQGYSGSAYWLVVALVQHGSSSARRGYSRYFAESPRTVFNA